MFSVVIPVFNHARFIEDAVWSAIRCPLVSEILLLDDGSRDDSPKIAASLAAYHPELVRDLTPASLSNEGAHNRLNQLIAAARCEWIAVLNSDDVFLADRFEAIIAEPAFRNADFAFGNIVIVNASGHIVDTRRGPFETGVPFPASFSVHDMFARREYLDLLSHQNYLSTTGNMIFRKTLHARVGGFSDFTYVHDWDFALRAMALGTAAYIPHFLTSYRMHSSNTIAENPDAVARESRAMFQRLVKDFPHLLSRPAFAEGAQFNLNPKRLA